MEITDAVKIGIEVETVVKDRNNLHLVSSTLSSYFSQTSDCSINWNRQKYPNGIGIEYVSRPFNYSELPQIIQALKSVKDYLHCNQSTGLHVHISFNGIDTKKYKRHLINLTKFIYNNQSIIVKLCNKTRENNRFCPLLRYSDIENIIKSRTDNKIFNNIYNGNINSNRLEQYKNNIYNGNSNNNRLRKSGGRYKALNLMPILDIGTVELRIFSATTDIELIKFYATMCFKIAQKTIETQKVRIFRGLKVQANNNRNNYKRLWEFLRSIDMLDFYKFSMKHYRALTTVTEPTTETING